VGIPAALRHGQHQAGRPSPFMSVSPSSDTRLARSLRKRKRIRLRATCTRVGLRRLTAKFDGPDFVYDAAPMASLSDN
jgi:hypothetical protein